MNGFTKKSVGTLTLGEKLRKIRSSKRISLNEVSRSTKIQVKYLEYLEQGEYEKLPVDVYVKGFLKSYADFLGVDEQILLKLYEKEKGIKKNLEKGKNPESAGIKPVNISSFVFTPKKVLIAAIVALTLAGFFFLYREIGSFASTPRLVVISPTDNSEISGNSVYVEGITEKDASLFINDQSILVSDEGKFRENLILQSGVNLINIKTVSKFEKEASQVITVRSNYREDAGKTDNPPAGGADKPEENKADSEGVQVELRVDPGPVWLSVEADGNLVFSGTMLTGAVQTFKASEKIVVNSGKGNATLVKFNGQDIGALTQEAGAVRGVIFTKDTKY